MDINILSIECVNRIGLTNKRGANGKFIKQNTAYDMEVEISQGTINYLYLGDILTGFNYWRVIGKSDTGSKLSLQSLGGIEYIEEKSLRKWGSTTTI